MNLNKDDLKAIKDIVETAIEDSKQHTAAGFAEVDKRFAEVHDKFAKIDDKFDKIDGKFAKIDDKFAEVHDKIDGVEQRLSDKIDRLEDVVFAEVKRVDDQSQVIQKMKKTLRAI